MSSSVETPGRQPRKGLSGAALVALAVLVLILLALVVGAFALRGGEPTTVAEVAEAAVDAAEDLDVDAGVDLLCDPPSERDRRELEALIAQAQERAGTDDPEVRYELSETTDEPTGQFTVTISSDTGDLADTPPWSIAVEVDQRGDRSCIDYAQRTG